MRLSEQEVYWWINTYFTTSDTVPGYARIWRGRIPWKNIKSNYITCGNSHPRVRSAYQRGCWTRRMFAKYKALWIIIKTNLTIWRNKTNGTLRLIHALRYHQRKNQSHQLITHMYMVWLGLLVKVTQCQHSVLFSRDLCTLWVKRRFDLPPDLVLQFQTFINVMRLELSSAPPVSASNWERWKIQSSFHMKIRMSLIDLAAIHSTDNINMCIHSQLRLIYMWWPGRVVDSEVPRIWSYWW